MIGAIVPGQSIAPEAAIRCHVDGQLRENGKSGGMTWAIDGVIGGLSTHVALAPGDLMMTGTGAGVGPVARGKSWRVEIDGLADAEFRYTI